MLLHEDRLFPAEAGTLKIARALYAHIQNLPIVSPHGHTQAAWFASNKPFPDPATLFVQPDHYVFRMLYSQGVSLDDLGIGQPRIEGSAQSLAHLRQQLLPLPRNAHAHLARFAFQELFGLEERLSEKNADLYFDTIAEKLQHAGVPAPRALRALQH